MKNTLKALALSLIVGLSFSNAAQAEKPHPIIKELYQAYQTGELTRLDPILHQDVLINSPTGFGNKGIGALKGWTNEFLVAFAPRIDLVDYINAVDQQGNGRAVATLNLHWKHVKPFFNVVQPTGRTGTAVINMILTVKGNKITRIDVADTTLDLSIYLYENGWTIPQNIRPVPLIKGIERPVETPAIRLRSNP